MSINNDENNLIYVNDWNNSGTKQNKSLNRITTSKYTWYSFVPMILWEQFQKLPNFYFLCGMLINLLIDTPVPVVVSVFPLIILLAFSFIMRGYEDIKCYISDKELNLQQVKLLTEDGFRDCSYELLQPGNVIKVLNNNSFPADMILLTSSRCETFDCSVTTANLDGENNLKTFNSVLSRDDNSLYAYLWKSKYIIEAAKPCEDLYKFHGKLLKSIDNSNNEYIRHISEKNVLLRGAKLKNTEFVIGVVVYVGKDTKLSLNSQIKQLKVTAIDNKLTIFVLTFVIIQALLSIIGTLLWNLSFSSNEWQLNNWYIPHMNLNNWKRVEPFFTFYILSLRFVPISLIYSIYSLKAVAAMFLSNDLQMYDEIGDNRVKVNSIEVIETLGQIEYLFSDKTGTLTENQMVFHSCSVGKDIFVDYNGKLCCQIGATEFDPIRLTRKSEDNDRIQQLMDLFICISVCHTVQASDKDGIPNIVFDLDILNTDELVYQASSPDEEAFLEALRRYGIIYLGFKKDHHFISILGEVQEFRIVEIFEFDSDRRCMSVIVHYMEDDTYWLVCKGAESSIFPKTKNQNTIDPFMFLINEFSVNGLRTLVVGKRELIESEVMNICKQMEELKNNVDDSNEMSMLFNELESDLQLIGVTGIEDRLQEDVHNTITLLRRAGIKVWVITGDKVETAINISLSAGHITNEMQIHQLIGLTTESVCFNKLTELYQRFVQQLDNYQDHALVIDGLTFQFLESELLRVQFVQVCHQMSAVLCCRMTPLQKSQTVSLVKTVPILDTKIKWVQPITAAIGDGGNDVSMILESDVGLAVFGREGRQAVRVADYALPKFRHLQQAILIHGQDFYERITTVILIYFYKSSMYVFPLFFFAFLSAASVVNFYDIVAAALYNVTFTTIPVLLFGAFNQEHTQRYRLDNPAQYQKHRYNSRLDYRYFILYSCTGCLDGLIVFVCVYLVLSNGGSVDSAFVGLYGHTYNYKMFGVLVLFGIWFVLNIKVILLTNFITRVSILANIINFVVSLLAQFIYQLLPSSQFDYHLLIHMFSEPIHYFIILISVWICITYHILIKLSVDYLTVKSMEKL